MAQELFTTFDKQILGEITLKPSDPGTFRIWLDDQLLFCRREQGRFPELKEIKQAIRDIVEPDRSLGHSDR
jgi:selenoprotein W-related protein